jgi:hypothetical protein
MTRGAWTTTERSLVGACAVGAVATAVVLPVVWRWLLTRPLGHGIEAAQWLNAVVHPVPACLALAAVVLTARPVGTVIALVSGLALMVANLQDVQVFGPMLAIQDYLSWVSWSVVLACALLAADVLAWRLDAFTVRTGALAGLAVALLQAAVELALYAFGSEGFPFSFALPTVFWIQAFALPSIMLVLTGVLGGIAVQGRGTAQGTAEPA